MKLPRCGECGGDIELRQGEGRTRELEYGKPVPIPASWPLPTCAKCGEIMMIPEVSEPLDAFLGYMVEHDLIDVDVFAHFEWLETGLGEPWPPMKLEDLGAGYTPPKVMLNIDFSEANKRFALEDIRKAADDLAADLGGPSRTKS